MGRMNQLNRLIKNWFSLNEAMVRMNDFYAAPEIQKGLIDSKSFDEEHEFAVKMKGSFSWGITPALEKSEKDKLKEKAKKKREEELDKTQGPISKWVRKMLPESSEKFDIPVAPRSLDNIMDIKDIDLNIKKGEFVVIIGEVGSGKSSLISAMIGEMIHIP